MLELGIALGVIAVFVAVVMAAAALSITAMLWIGVWTIVTGMAVGLPAGVGYHLAMHRGLAESAITAPRWWWSPVRYHAQLSVMSRRRMMPWFVAGVSGATLAFVGCALLLICLFRLRGLEG